MTKIRTSRLLLLALSFSCASLSFSQQYGSHALNVVPATPVAAAPVEIVCPSDLSVEEKLSQPIDGWKSRVVPAANQLSDVDFYDGSPEQGTRLEPIAKSVKGDQHLVTWDVWTIAGPEREAWISCVYSGTNVELSRPLPRNVKTCTVAFSRLVNSADLGTPEGISCELAKDEPAPKYRPREVIRMPKDCEYRAHGGDYETQSDMCAETLDAAFRAISNSALKRGFEEESASCDDVFDNSDATRSGVEAPERDGVNIRVTGTDEPRGWALSAGDMGKLYDPIKFIPIGKGRFLLKIVCGQGAYNESAFVFAYDEAHMNPAKIGDSYGTRPAPPLILFPSMHEKNSFRYLINYREYDRLTSTLYDLDKATGLGCAGEYAEYKIDRETFVPALRRSYYGVRDDHSQPCYGGVVIGQYPKPPNWHRDDISAAPAGCLIDIANGVLTAPPSCQVSPKP